MKANAFSILALALLISVNPVVAQQKKTAPKTSQKKTIKTETIVIKEKPKDGKTTVEIRDGRVYINGDEVTSFNGNSDDIDKKIVIEHDGSSAGSGFSFDRGMVSTRKAMLGVLARPGSEDGAIVDRVSPNSAAEKIGLQEGDKITKINDKEIKSAQDLVDAIAQYDAGDKVTVSYERNGQEKASIAELTKATSSDNQPRMFGFGPNGMPNTFEMPNSRPFSFDIDDFMATPPRLGITGEDMSDESGVKVVDVKAGSVAAVAGLQNGDIIYKLGGNDVRNVSSLQNAVREARTGSPVNLKYERNGKDYETQVTFKKPTQKKEL
jgi:serine protease Do